MSQDRHAGSPGRDRKANARLLRDLHREAAARLDAILWDVDPEGFREMGAPRNEYDLEVGTILPRLRSARTVEATLAILVEEGERWFGPHWKGDPDRLRRAAERIVAEVLPVFPSDVPPTT